MRLVWFGLWAALACVALARGARADETPAPATEKASSDDEKRQRAKRHFLRGLELVQAENWDGALAEFLASREIFPTQVALKNAAISLSQLKRNAQALEMYRELVTRFGSSLSPEDRRAIDDAMAQLAAGVGRVVITSNPPGCTVVVDGRERGKTPLASAIELDAGTHTVRISRSGYETHESQLLVAGGQSRSIVAELSALRAAGILVVTEIDGKRVEVVVDGAVVGIAPWTGTVSPGAHAVFLRGEGDLGTPPSSALVKNGETTTLRLRAEKLDSLLRIVPTPSNAQVNVDGVALGNGVWEGRLKSGPHQIEVAAEGFVPYRRQLVTQAGKPLHQRVTLERDLTNPMWRAGFVPHLYFEALGGPAWAPSFGGGADAACSSDGDCERSRPFGALAGARAGYELIQGFGLELFLGVLYLKETTRRRLVAGGENGDWVADDYQDESEMFGPAAAASASARFFEQTPLTFRLWAGVARVKGSFTNQGTFTGTVAYQPPTGPEETASSTQAASIPEQSARIWMPFLGPEARIGYRFSKRFSMDVGVAVLFMFPPDAPRTGLTAESRREGDRKTAMRDVTLPSGGLARGGVMSLPRENAFGTFVAVVPSLGARFDL